MARRKKFAFSDLPEPGMVYAMPLKDGRIGICRVLRREELEIPCVVVAASDWIGNEPPRLDDPAVRKILILNHHNWTERPEVLWVSTPPPKEFKLLGKIDILPPDSKQTCNSFSSWDSFSIQVLAQWRWDNEHEAVLAEDEKRKGVQTAQRNEEIEKRANYLAAVSFAELMAKDLFPTWEDYPPKQAKAGCQKIIRSLIQSLHVAKKPLDRNFVESELKKCVEALNQFDSQNENFIETVEREDLCEVLEDVVNAAKFPNLIEKVEDWRDW